MERLPFKSRVELLNTTLGKSEDACAQRWLAGQDIYAPGEAVQVLHRQITELWQCGQEGVASFMGGRAAFYAVVRTLGLQPGDQVLIPAFTCQCVTNALTYNGVEARFVDIETETFGMDAEALAKSITPRTRAVMIQYSFGLVCRDLESLLSLASRHGLWIIEDCAHATGASYRGQLLGTLGDIAFFSSERSKIVNTIHGGWVITRDPALKTRLQQVYAQTADADPLFIRALLRTLRHAVLANQQGKATADASWPQEQRIPQMQQTELSGLFSPQYHWRMAEPVAELLTLQLNQLPELLLRRRRGAEFWRRWALKQGYPPALTLVGAENSWLRFPLMLSAEQKQQKAALEQALNVDVGVWFTTPMHPQPLLLPDCPTGMLAAAGCINLPTWLPE
ncbi:MULTISPECIES: aminotransferase class I/II-fold pyridoxal phosphate-dependent enzyme [Serratia]|uniref:aminotransferase class I/II-fold pyridoxal phosphate-dependent enzyme n=1 Tax=Serratia TaxID=613 RepID=UPI0010C3FCA3|nr:MULTISPECIES: aminotransferase class I/II-fold pyridoxal phosphate-dependent enzyme [Serratia]AVU30182.1 perosamine synthetase [Serratia marcescens]EIV2912369.1 aminotransferase class I/II-fold pyridoxal phosphate-dependent enzyme [Serratia marcescens]MBH2723718.1 aminotransferase class I/II-fold pyridoxal phosphate-dependent enzyme [Serratia marcescens]MBH2814043.1 aminotransferase class I/II-fold pyridoxal phosphate-dependent enzyme [Serratia marcescens]MBH3102347.1 aminotransferase class